MCPLRHSIALFLRKRSAIKQYCVSTPHRKSLNISIILLIGVPFTLIRGQHYLNWRPARMISIIVNEIATFRISPNITCSRSGLLTNWGSNSRFQQSNRHHLSVLVASLAVRIPLQFTSRKRVGERTDTRSSRNISFTTSQRISSPHWPLPLKRK